MPVDTTELRKASTAVYLATEQEVARDLSRKLRDSADELDALRAALARTPHGTLCGFMMALHQEPCSCWKSAATEPPILATPLLADATSVTFLNATRLNVNGPHGRVVGLLGVTGVHVEQDDDGRTIRVTYEQQP